MRTRLPLLLIALGSLLGVAPATRPAVPDPTRFQLRVRTYVGVAVLTSVDLAVGAGEPFNTVVTVGEQTLTLDGTLRPTGRRAWRLELRYDDAVVDRPTGGYSHHGVSTALEPDLGRETNLCGDGDPARPRRRTAVTVTAVP